MQCLQKSLSVSENELIKTLLAFYPQNDGTFLDAHLVLHMLNLTNSKVVHSEFVVSRQFLHRIGLVSSCLFYGHVEKSFSTLKNVLTDKRKAHLVQLAFEKDLTRTFWDEWK